MIINVEEKNLPISTFRKVIFRKHSWSFQLAQSESDIKKYCMLCKSILSSLVIHKNYLWGKSHRIRSCLFCSFLIKHRRTRNIYCVLFVENWMPNFPFSRSIKQNPIKWKPEVFSRIAQDDSLTVRNH